MIKKVASIFLFIELKKLFHTSKHFFTFALLFDKGVCVDEKKHIQKT